MTKEKTTAPMVLHFDVLQHWKLRLEILGMVPPDRANGFGWHFHLSIKRDPVPADNPHSICSFDAAQGLVPI